MTTPQKAFVAITIAMLAGLAFYEARRAASLQQQVDLLRHQLTPLTEEFEQVSRDRDEVTNQIATLRNENKRLSNNIVEVLRLRRDLGFAQKQISELRSEQKRSNEGIPINTALTPRRVGADTLLSIRGQIDELSQQFDAQSLKIEQLARDLNLPPDISSNTPASSDFSQIAERYPALFEAFAHRERTRASRDRLILLETNAALKLSP